MKNKKGIGPVVAATLLLTVVTIAITGFSTWYETFSSSTFVNVEEKTTVGQNLEIETITGGKIYIDSKKNITIKKLIVNNIDCDINNNLSKGVNKIDIQNCLDNLTTKTPYITLITDSEVVEKKIYIKNNYITVNEVLSIVGYNSSFGQWFGSTTMDRVSSIYVDSSGNIYVGGTIDGNIVGDNLIPFNGTPSGNEEGFIVKFDNYGKSLWGQWLGSGGSDAVNVVYGDNSGNIYVGGYTSSSFAGDNLITLNGTHSGFGKEAFIIKFNSLGESLWGQWIGAASEDDAVESIYIDNSDNIYVGGYGGADSIDDNLTTFNGTPSGNNEGFIAKFDSNGKHLWGQWIGGTSHDYVYSIKGDNSGNIFIGGTISDNGNDDNLTTFNGTHSGGFEGFIAKFDSQGNNLWGQWIGGTGTDYVKSIELDSSGNTYVGGYVISDISDDNMKPFNGTFSGAGFHEGFIAKFDSQGNNLWAQWFGSTAHDYIESIKVDSSGNVYVGGSSDGDMADDGLVSFNGTYSGGFEAFVAKFDSDGNSIWGQWIGNDSTDQIKSIDLDSSNNIYVGGLANKNIVDDNLVSLNGTHSGNNEGFIFKLETILG